MKTVHYLLDVFIDEGVKGDVFGPLLELRGCWQFTVQQQVRYFEIGALLCKLIDWISAVLQDSLVAIDERDAALAGGGIHKSRVVSHQAKVVIRNLDLTQIHGLYRAVLNWQLILFSR